MILQRIVFILGFIVGCLIAGTVFADTNTLTWVNPTQYTDGTPFASLCCVNIYRGAKADGSDALFLIQIKGIPASYADLNMAPGTYCYKVQAISSKAGDVYSDFSAVACKTVIVPPAPKPQPKPPSNLTNQ